MPKSVLSDLQIALSDSQSRCPLTFVHIGTPVSCPIQISRIAIETLFDP